jgi:putative transposon-encoded protein
MSKLAVISKINKKVLSFYKKKNFLNFEEIKTVYQKHLTPLGLPPAL